MTALAPAYATGGASPMHVDIIERLDAFVALRPNWEAVYAADADAQFFLSWQWIHGCLEDSNLQWMVLAVRLNEGERYVAFMPVKLRCQRNRNGYFYNELQTAGGPLSSYNGFIADARHEEDAMHALCIAIRSFNWTRVVFDNLRLSPVRMQRFLETLAANDCDARKLNRPDDGDGIDHDVYVYVDLPRDFETYLMERMGARTRAHARKALRAMEQPENRVVFAGAETIQGDVESLCDHWLAQWTPLLGKRYGAAVPGNLARQYRRKLLHAYECGALFMLVFWHDGARVGEWAGFVDWKNRSLIGFVSGRDKALKSPSPGVSLHLFAIRWAIENGLEIYDLLTGNFPYKYDLGGVEQMVNVYEVRMRNGMNWRGILEPRSISRVKDFARERFAANDLEAAIIAARQIIAAAPQDEEAIDLLGQISLRKKQYALAEQVYAEAVRLEPGSARFYFYLGVAQGHLGKLEQALEALDRSLELAPGLESTLKVRATIVHALATGYRPRATSPADARIFQLA